MVSTIRFRSVKAIDVGWRRSYLALFLAAVVIALIASHPRLALVIMSYAYVSFAFLMWGVSKIGKRPLDLTFKEFELLKFLAQHPGRVFSRQQLLQEVWGYDYFGGTRTVDVHVRRLRAKLGPDNETLIGTVRNVGYRFVVPAKEKDAKEASAATSPKESSSA